MKKFILFSMLLLVIFFIPSNVKGEAICDDFGYCVENPKPSYPVITLHNFPNVLEYQMAVDWRVYATAYSERDGDLTARIEITNNYDNNYNLCDNYFVTYSVTDNLGRTTTVTRWFTLSYCPQR